MQSKRQRTQPNPDLSFLRLDGSRSLIPSVQALIFDYLDSDHLSALGAVSQTARLFLQHYLAHCTALAISDKDQHQLLPLAVLHCRKLARIHAPSSSAPSPSITRQLVRLVRHNAAALQTLSGRAVDNPAMLTALLECPHLQSLYVGAGDDSSDALVLALIAQSRQLKSLRFGPEYMTESFTFLTNVMKRAPPGLTALATPFLMVDELSIAATRFTSLQVLHVELMGVEEFLPTLRQMTSLTDLSVTEEDLGFKNAAVIRSYLRSKGYDRPSWGSAENDAGADEADVEADPDFDPMEVLELPRLRKLKLDAGCTNVFVVHSKVLEEVSLAVNFEVLLALEMLKHSPTLRKADISVYSQANPDPEVFADVFPQWPQLTAFASNHSIGDQALSALAAHCPRLETVNASLGPCRIDSILALLALPCLTSVNLGVARLVTKATQGEGCTCVEEETESVESSSSASSSSSSSSSSDSPPLIYSNVRSLKISGRWHQRLVDRLRLPRLRLLDLQVCVRCPHLVLDSLLHSASTSLVSLAYFFRHCVCRARTSSTFRLVSEGFDWSGFTQLETVKVVIGQGSAVGANLVREAPKIRLLTAYLYSHVDLGRLLNAPSSTLRILNVEHAAKVWPARCLDYILPSLLHPDLRPQALDNLRVPAGTLSSDGPLQFSLSRLPDVLPGGISISVKSYQPIDY